MTTEVSAEGSGRCRYTYRLRLSSTTRTALEVEWDRVRWVWKECVAKSRTVHARNRATGEETTCGPVQLAAMQTEARARTAWLKKREALPTLECTRRGFRLKHGRLHLAGGIVVRPVRSRQLPKPPSSVRVYRDAVGHWWASFAVPAVTEAQPSTPGV